MAAVIRHLGLSLEKQGSLFAAQTCFLLVGSLPTLDLDAPVDLVLPGLDHHLHAGEVVLRPSFWQLQAMQALELIEHVRYLELGSHALLPKAFVVKLAIALTCFELGREAECLAYCEAIMHTLQMSQAHTWRRLGVTRQLLMTLADLAARCLGCSAQAAADSTMPEIWAGEVRLHVLSCLVLLCLC